MFWVLDCAKPFFENFIFVNPLREIRRKGNRKRRKNENKGIMGRQMNKCLHFYKRNNKI